jgi:hypothetical protein
MFFLPFRACQPRVEPHARFHRLPIIIIIIIIITINTASQQRTPRRTTLGKREQGADTREGKSETKKTQQDGFAEWERKTRPASASNYTIVTYFLLASKNLLRSLGPDLLLPHVWG